MASFDIETFVGPSFVFICLSLISSNSSLYGLVIAQVYYYFTTYRDDLFHRLLVLLLCVLETVHSIACIHVLYTLTIIGFADVRKFSEIPWSAGVAVYLEVVISTVVHLIWRRKILFQANTRYEAQLTVFTARVGRYHSSLFLLFHAHRQISTSQWSHSVHRRHMGKVGGFDFIHDLSVTAMVLYSLLRRYSMAHSRNTKYIMRKLVQYALSSGVLTAPLLRTQFNVFPSDLHYGGTLMLLTKVYANSMLAMLNRRQGIKDEAPPNDGVSVHLSNLSGGTNGARPTATRIQVVRDTVTASDTWLAEEASKTRGLEPVLCEELPHAPKLSSKC
ncbi:hypothetical protein BC629DRAFT_1435861 [Irpex lacteus]|nr:hypothetical protein BC629DRAFT_1435861 [Irpex lacteus]